MSAKRLLLVGPYDENLKLIELRMKVSINYRGNEFRFGRQAIYKKWRLPLNQLYKDTEFRESLEAEFVHMRRGVGMSELVELDEANLESFLRIPGQVTVRTYKRIKPRGKIREIYPDNSGVRC